MHGLPIGVSMSGNSDNTSDDPVNPIQWITNHILPDGANNVEATQRRCEELEAEAEQLRVRGEQLAVRVEARQTDNHGNEDGDGE
jgi:hypothetical protein